MSAKSKTRVTVGHARLTVYAWTHPQTGRKGWRWAHKDAEGKWRYHTHPTKDAAILAAEAHLREQQTGAPDLGALPPSRVQFLQRIHQAVGSEDEERAVIDFLRTRKKSSDVAGAVAQYIAGKQTSAGGKTPHLETVRNDLESMAKHFDGKLVSDIHLPGLAEWVEIRAGSSGPKRAKDIRGNLLAFWRWAQREGIAGADPIPLASRLPIPHVPDASLRYLSLDELRLMIDAIDSQYRAWLVLGAFAGMRPEEIAPHQNTRPGKRGLRAEEIDWKFRVIRIPACVSKVNRARIVPFSDALASGLEWAGITAESHGPVCLQSPTETREQKRIGKLIFGGEWPRNVLRHSYGTTRNAVLRNLPQVAEEMGTSVAMLHAHYHNPQPEQVGHEWFAFRFVPINSAKTRKTSHKAFSESLKYQQKRA